MSQSSYIFVHGVRETRSTLRGWQQSPAPVLGRWLAGSVLAAAGLLGAVLVISHLFGGAMAHIVLRPPFVVGNAHDVLGVMRRNLLVLALHAMACVAGFIAGSSLPLQAEGRHGASLWVHEHGGHLAIIFVAAATTYSLATQAYLLGHQLAAMAGFFRVSPGVLLLSVMPHAVLELVALFLPLAAWIVASRRGEWEQLLAATLVTVAIALPVLAVAALIEVFVSPHLFVALTGIRASLTS